MASKKLWGGRFAKATDPRVERYTRSIEVDARLARYDVLGSIAHAQMLGACRIIRAGEAKRLVGGLRQLLRTIEQGRFVPDPDAEDIHSQIEAMLIRRLGPVAEKLHTARSRNDQVALDFRLWCRDAVAHVQAAIRELQHALVDVAEAHADVVIPGYTHLQRAQPVLLAHHLLAYVEMLERDHGRLRDALVRIDVLPLGAAALAGTSLPIDRRFVAKRLGFARIADNSLDAVSDRDFAVELLAACALLGVHLSRFAEDLILWATEEFGIIDLDDAFATGSSLMPHKKNPDVLELARGQAGLIIGQLGGLLSVLKSLPLAYNRDLQWDKPVVFQAVDGVVATLNVLAPLVQTLRVRRDRVKRLLQADTLCATDLAEHLVQRGVPFRTAHQIVGQLVLAAERQGCSLRRVPKAQRVAIAPELASIDGVLDPAASVARKRSWGGTNPRHVRAAIKRWKVRLKG